MSTSSIPSSVSGQYATNLTIRYELGYTTNGVPTTTAPNLETSFYNSSSTRFDVANTTKTISSRPISIQTISSGSRIRSQILSATQLWLFLCAVLLILVQSASAGKDNSRTSATTDLMIYAPVGGPQPPAMETTHKGLELKQRATVPFAKEFAEAAAGWFGKKVYKLADWGMDFLTSKLLTVDIAAECTTVVLAIAWGGGPPGELAGALIATATCNAFIPYMMYHMDGPKQFQKALDDICEEIVNPKPGNNCFTPGAKVHRPNLLNDPNNCGLCGRKVSYFQYLERQNSSNFSITC